VIAVMVSRSLVKSLGHALYIFLQHQHLRPLEWSALRLAVDSQSLDVLHSILRRSTFFFSDVAAMMTA
jgi:hypothetical protein